MRHNEKSENIARGRRLLVVASQTVGVVAVHRPHRRPNPFISGQSFHFQMTGALGDTMLIPLSLTVRVSRHEQIGTSATRRANREEKDAVKENNEVSRCKTAGALLHRDCWRNRDEAVRQRLGRDSRAPGYEQIDAVQLCGVAVQAPPSPPASPSPPLAPPPCACYRGSHTSGDDHPPCSAGEHVAQPFANKGAQRTVCQEESRRPAMAGPSGESRGEKPFLGVVPENSEKKKRTGPEGQKRTHQRSAHPQGGFQAPTRRPATHRAAGQRKKKIEEKSYS